MGGSFGEMVGSALDLTVSRVVQSTVSRGADMYEGTVDLLVLVCRVQRRIIPSLASRT